tara:strand:- start:791 stop:2281 length:1491 start_codon:yes stop_codon:yes gene_type:complete
MIDLYEDQEEFIGEIRKIWNKHRRIVGMMPTGGGKTRCAARIIEGCVSKGMRVCFLVPRITLISQTAQSFTELGLTDITYLWGDYETNYNAKITIASIDTYIRREKGDYDLVIVDEMHHRRAVLLKWMEEHPKDRYLGLSATPFSDWIGNYYTGLAKSKSMKWLMDNDRLSKYEVFAPSTPDLSGVKVGNTPMGKDYQESALGAIMGDAKVIGDVVKHWLEHGENRLTMALCVNVLHANFLCVEFNKNQIPSEVITAKTPVEDRERVFGRMRSGVTKVVLSVNCLTEGFDLPQVSCLINARPTKSKARYIQGIGRSLRYLPGKTALIFDHSGTTLDLGFPEDIDIDELSTGKAPESGKPQKNSDEKPEKKPKLCPKCAYLKEAGVYSCPKCGFAPLMGIDTDVDESRGLTKISGKKKVYTKSDKQSFYSGLLGYQKEQLLNGKSCSDGYIANTYRDKFFVWPKGLDKRPSTPPPEVLGFIKSKRIAWVKAQNKLVS